MQNMTVDLDSPSEVADFISAWVNRASYGDFEEVSGLLCLDHRTLQQSFASFIMTHLGTLAKNSTDARNEYAVKAAQAGYNAMVEALNGATRLPLI